MITAKIPLAEANSMTPALCSALLARVLATNFTALLHHNVVYLSADIG